MTMRVSEIPFLKLTYLVLKNVSPRVGEFLIQLQVFVKEALQWPPVMSYFGRL